MIFIMQRRVRVDLGQRLPAREEEKLNRKRLRWEARNKDRPEDNPFVTAIKPTQVQYGEAGEDENELRARLNNLEFGNFPGYFKYRNKAAAEQKSDHANGDTGACPKPERDDLTATVNSDDGHTNNQQDVSSSIDAGLSDERLQHLNRVWFEGKEILDIGCNRGHITYAIASLYQPRFIIGIDIDEKMVNMANKDLHLHLESKLIDQFRENRRTRAAKQRLAAEKDSTTDSSYLEDLAHFPISSYINSGPLISVSSVQKEEATEVKFPNNILFIEHNYVLSRDELVEKQKPYFDTIVCLSVTKWIHLNYRDEGLKRFFKRIYHHLRPGGLLVLEAQPFDNYGRRKRLSDRLKANFYSIKFKPEQFDDYLLGSEVGFREVIYNSVTDHRCIGFKRPLKVYIK